MPTFNQAVAYLCFNFPKSTFLSLGLVYCLVQPGLAQASNAKAPQAELETVTVTTSRTELPLQDSGSAISIINRQTILDSNATSVAELLRTVPGLHINQQGSRGAVTQLRVRGAEANQVLVLIDGVEANDIAQGGEFNFAHLMTNQIERIEVVRGPQSALWGSDALSGVINIITLGDNVVGQKFSANLESGSFNSRRAGVSWLQRNDASLVKLSLNQFDTDGTNISRVGDEKDGYKNTTANMNAKWFLTDDTQLDTSLRYTKSQTDFDATDFVVTGLPVDANNVTDANQLYARVALNLSSFDGQYQQTFSFARTDTNNENDVGNSVNDVADGKTDQWLYQGDIYFGASVLSLVAEVETLQYRQRGPISFGDPNKDLHTDNKSLAFEYRLNRDAWDLSLSGRHDRNSDFDNSNTYRATAAWQTPIAAVHLFTSYGKAIKNPTFTERFGFFQSFVGNPDLSPEASTSWEVGLRQINESGSLRSSISYFSSKLENEINGFVFDSSTSGFTAKNIDGDSSRQGAEIEIGWLATEQLKLRAAYSYIDSTSEDAAGKQVDEVRRPRNTASLGINYEWERANINLSAAYNGSQADDFFPPFPASQTRVTLDSYTLMNLAGRYQLTDQLTLTLRLENLLDEDYEEVFGYASPGFAAYGGVKFQW